MGRKIVSGHERSTTPKVCRCCQTEKPASEFHSQRANVDGLQSWCKSCNRARNRKGWTDKASVMTDTEWQSRRAARRADYHANRAARRASANARRMLERYGITIEEYDRMLAAQGGRCAICESTEPGGPANSKRFAVDHDHTTGAVRALLCMSCNTRIGLLEQQVWMTVAVQYLAEHHSAAAAYLILRDI